MMKFIKIFQLLKSYIYFHILASALPWSGRIGIRQAHWLDLIGFNLRAKNYRNIPTVSRVKSVFANCHILASAQPQSRKRWHLKFLCLDLVNINVYTILSKHPI